MPPRETDRILGQRSKFWERLGTAHAQDLDVHGAEFVKRKQALRYFTWRWKLSKLARGEQARFLLAHSRFSTLLRCVLTPPDLRRTAWAGVSWGLVERWAYTAAVRALWEYARVHDTESVLRLPEPEVGSPLPVRWEDRLISQDLANSALEAAAIGRATRGRAVRTILEIGAGYGRTAYALLHTYSDAIYTIVDVEPALSIARWYLGQLFPAGRVQFLRPDQAILLPQSSFDLALSISSLQEMTSAQVTEYLRLLNEVAAGGVVYLKQWAEWRNPDDQVTLRFDSYPIPKAWEPIFDEPSPVQTSFRQAAWRLPSPTC